MAADVPTSVETHISWVLLGDEQVLKVYKPVATDVLDHRRVEQRRAACRHEVELNARLSPDVYRGVAEVQLEGDDLEPVIVMRRLPAARRLAALLGSAEAPDLVRQVARTMATFHASLAPLEPDAAVVASPQALANRWADDVAGLAAAGGGSLDARAEEIGALARQFLAGREPLLDQRISEGMVRDGHGDLLADDIFCLDDGPRILDCLAFCDELRWGDVLADVAFLVMDVQRLGHPVLARSFLHDYCEYSGEHHPGSLAHLYVAQRALVRAKVAALRSSQTGRSSPEVDALTELTLDHLRRAEVRLTLVGGLPGSGKSTFAGRLGDELGWAVLSSDDVRRDLGLRSEDLHDPSAYDEATVARVYEEMRARAGTLLAFGVPVVLDATFTSGRERSQARALAADHHASVLEVVCEAPLDECRARVAGRGRSGSSEATPDVVDRLAARADPWPEAIAVDTSGTADPPSTTPAYRAEVTALWWHGAPTSQS